MAIAPSTNLAPTTHDLVLYAGDGAILNLTVLDPTTSEPLNITGTVRAHIRAQKSDPTPAAQFTSDLSEAALGKITLELTGADTQPLIADRGDYKGFWDCEWDPISGEPLTLYQGKVTVIQDVTR